MKYALFLLTFSLSCTKPLLTRPRLESKLSTTPARPKISIQLLLSLDSGPENTADGVVVIFDNAFPYSIGNDDSYKMANPDENLAINEKGTMLSIEGKPMPAYQDSTFLNIWNFRQSNYYLKIACSNFLAGYTGRVYDRYLKTTKTINVYGTTTIAFTGVESMPFRYKLYIKKI